MKKKDIKQPMYKPKLHRNQIQSPPQKENSNDTVKPMNVKLKTKSLKYYINNCLRETHLLQVKYS